MYTRKEQVGKLGFSEAALAELHKGGEVSVHEVNGNTYVNLNDLLAKLGVDVLNANDLLTIVTEKKKDIAKEYKEPKATLEKTFSFLTVHNPSNIIYNFTTKQEFDSIVGIPRQISVYVTNKGIEGKEPYYKIAIVLETERDYICFNFFTFTSLTVALLKALNASLSCNQEYEIIPTATKVEVRTVHTKDSVSYPCGGYCKTDEVIKEAKELYRKLEEYNMLRTVFNVHNDHIFVEHVWLN